VSLTLTYYAGTYTLATLPSSGGSSTAPSAAGSYTVVAAFAGSADYSVGSALAAFSIGKATPAVSVSDAGGTYTGSAFGASASVAGVVSGVDSTPAASLEGVSLALTYYSGTYTLATLPSSGSSSAAPTAAGSYTMLASFAGSADYTGSTALATFSIGKATPAVSVSAAGGTYAGSAFGASATINGGSSLEGVSPTLTYFAGTYTSATQLAGLTPLAGAPTDAAGYTVVASFAGSQDFVAGNASANFTINPAPLTATVAGLTKTYGQTIDLAAALGSTVATGVNGEALAVAYSSVGAAASADVVRNADGSLGGYPITAALANGTGKLANYAVMVVPGNLTVRPADQTIAWAAPAPIVTKTALNSNQLNATVSVVGPAPAGTLTYSPPAGTILAVGTQTLTVNVAATNDYNAASASVLLPVRYVFSGFLPPLAKQHTFGLGRTIPIKFQLRDANGNQITSLSAIQSLQIQALDSQGNPVGAPFNPASAYRTGLTFGNGDDTNGADGDHDDHFIFYWKTKGLTAGNYQIVLTLNDGTVPRLTVQLKNQGVDSGLVSAGSGSGIGGAAVALLAGNIELYVDNSGGNFSADELARIEDAIQSTNAVVGAYGAYITEVTDPTEANFVLDSNTTSAVGGFADGVLGCTADTGEITVILGWNWYAGSDNTAVGPDQYDFQTVVTHELGHALGLGHSATEGSVMYATLAPGTANRVLCTADLAIPDDGDPACGLHAGPKATALSPLSQPPLPPPAVAKQAVNIANEFDVAVKSLPGAVGPWFSWQPIDEGTPPDIGLVIARPGDLGTTSVRTTIGLFESHKLAIPWEAQIPHKVALDRLFAAWDQNMESFGVAEVAPLKVPGKQL
jgi:hypothetical protein